jgi:hypothetical protein
VGRARRPPALPAYEPPPYENGRTRAVKKSDTRIPGIGPELGSGYREWDAERNDTLLQGHPEAAGVFTMNYDHNSPDLTASPERMDENYVGPEEIRRKSKGGLW